jgi:uncharacterized iron-regulated membrane protein
MNRIITYILGFGAGAACIISPFVTHASTNNAVAMAIFGVAIIVAMILIVMWNKAGKSKFDAGAGSEDHGLSATVDMETSQWLIVLAVVAGGLILAIVAHLVIPH